MPASASLGGNVHHPGGQRYRNKANDRSKALDKKAWDQSSAAADKRKEALAAERTAANDKKDLSYADEKEEDVKKNPNWAHRENWQKAKDAREKEMADRNQTPEQWRAAKEKNINEKENEAAQKRAEAKDLGNQAFENRQAANGSSRVPVDDLGQEMKPNADAEGPTPDKKGGQGQAPKKEGQPLPEDEKQNQRYFNVEKRKDEQVQQQEAEGAEGGAPQKPYRQMEGQAEPEEQGGKEGQGSQTKKNGGSEDQVSGDNEQKELQRKLQALQRSVAQGKIRESAKAAKQIAKDVLAIVAQAVTAELMVQSWFNIIDTFGLTLLYLNFHFVLKYISHSRYVCRFGHEWAKSFTTGKAGQASNMASQATEAGGGEEDSNGFENMKEVVLYAVLEIVEIGLLLFIDLMLLLLLIICTIIIFAPLMIVAGAVMLIPASLGL